MCSWSVTRIKEVHASDNKRPKLTTAPIEHHRVVKFAYSRSDCLSDERVLQRQDQGHFRGQSLLLLGREPFIAWQTQLGSGLQRALMEIVQLRSERQPGPAPLELTQRWDAEQRN